MINIHFQIPIPNLKIKHIPKGTTFRPTNPRNLIKNILPIIGNTLVLMPWLGGNVGRGLSQQQAGRSDNALDSH